MSISQKRRKRRGLSCVEMALVLPLLLLLTFGIIEYSIQFYVRGEMTNAAREGARRLAVYDATVEQARAVALARLSGLNGNFSVSASLTPPGASDRDATVRISVPMGDITSGIIVPTDGKTLTAEVTMRREDD
ncbi:MAG: TadE/TadG family type IV pilus assembly protein [Planctomycetaceae bacterium]|nr:pilus assembly protein [Planctomycetaceae bacterium]